MLRITSEKVLWISSIIVSRQAAHFVQPEEIVLYLAEDGP